MGVRCVVHGDDFTFTGKREDLLEINGKLEDSYEFKMRALLGDEPEDDREITILNRRIRWEGGCVHYEADTKHVSEILKYFNLCEESKSSYCAVCEGNQGRVVEGWFGAISRKGERIPWIGSSSQLLVSRSSGHPVRCEGDLS